MSEGRLAVLSLSALLALASCGPATEAAEDLGQRPVRVVATTSIVADLVRQVGGDRVEVTSLMGPGVDPHLYRASEGDVSRMANADIVIYSGLHLEGRMVELFEQMAERGLPTAAVSDGVDPSLLLAPPEFKGAHDPHIWMDVTMWRAGAAHVGEALAELDPTNAEAYRAGAAAYAEHLTQVDAQIRERVGQLPEERRVLVTAHDAFNYFGKAYGFEVRGVQGISTVAEAGTADIQELARFVADRRIPALFVETSVSPRSIEAVQAAVRARGFEVVVGGNLFSDALGGEGSGAETYETMILHNVETIVSALSGEE